MAVSNKFSSVDSDDSNHRKDDNSNHGDMSSHYGANDPPLVPAVEAPSITMENDGLLVANNVHVVASEEQPLLVRQADQSTSFPPDSLSSDPLQQQYPMPEDGQPVLTEKEKKEKARMMGAGVATGILGRYVTFFLSSIVL